MLQERRLRALGNRIIDKGDRQESLDLGGHVVRFLRQSQGVGGSNVNQRLSLNLGRGEDAGQGHGNIVIGHCPRWGDWRHR